MGTSNKIDNGRKLPKLFQRGNKPAPLGHPRWGGKQLGHAAPERWWSVPRSWAGETCFILAGGPSLRQMTSVDVLRGRARVIVVNDSYQLAPWADVLYWADMKWWRAHQGDVIDNFAGLTVSVDQPRLSWVKSLHDLGQLGLSHDPTGIYRGNNSGYAAISLAYLFGVKRICLLGYDMRTVDGKTHWHRGHSWNPETIAKADRKLSESFIPTFEYLRDPLAKTGVEVWNCTPGSALHTWPFRPFGWCLRQAVQDADAKMTLRGTESDRLGLVATVTL